MDYLRAACRLASVISYGLSLLIFHHLHPIAAKAYEDLCSRHGMTFPEGPSARYLGTMMIVLAVPLLLARSNILIATNLIMGLITILGACSLFATAGNIPYECFTIGGYYEDRTSGLDDFDWWLLCAVLLSYGFLVIDLTVWSVKRLIALRANYAGNK
jgi:hypothetical protein